MLAFFLFFTTDKQRTSGVFPDELFVVSSKASDCACVCVCVYVCLFVFPLLPWFVLKSVSNHRIGVVNISYHIHNLSLCLSSHCHTHHSITKRIWHRRRTKQSTQWQWSVHIVGFWPVVSICVSPIWSCCSWTSDLARCFVRYLTFRHGPGYLLCSSSWYFVFHSSRRWVSIVATVRLGIPSASVERPGRNGWTGTDVPSGRFRPATI